MAMPLCSAAGSGPSCPCIKKMRAAALDFKNKNRTMLVDSAIMDFLLSFAGKFDMYVEDECAAYVRYCFATRWTPLFLDRASSQKAGHLGWLVEGSSLGLSGVRRGD